MVGAENYTILLVEDSPVDERVIRHILEKEGYAVYSAMNQTDGLRMIKELNPDLVIIDMVLPDGDGLTICRTIKALTNEENHNLPVMILTVKRETKDIVAGFRCGADDYVIKPPIRDDLLARVKRLLRTRQLHVELKETYFQLSRTVHQINRELDIVADIQRSFLPTQLPEHPNIRLSVKYIPSMKAGGDYYDVVPVDDNHWGIVMADIAGHGASAAVIMALTQMTVKEFSSGIIEPDQALHRFQDVLARHVKTGHFVTMLYSVLNLDTLEYRYTSAGHPPALFVQAKTGEIKELRNQEGYPLLTFENRFFDVHRIVLNTGDKLILFTDGVLDVKNADDTFFGFNRLKKLIKKAEALSGQELLQHIFETLKDFNHAKSYADDVSMMIIEHTG